MPLCNNAEYENNRFFLLSMSNYFMEKTFLFHHQRILKRPLGLREPTENFNDRYLLFFENDIHILNCVGKDTLKK